MKKTRLVGWVLLFTVAGLVFSCKSTRTGSAKPRERTSKKEYYSKKFDLELDRESNLKLYESVDGWIGVKYKFGSCTKSGVDCSCLVNAIYRETFRCDPPRDTKGLEKEAKRIDKGELKEGDLVFFKMGTKVDHVGIYLSNKKFVHASTKKGVMISSLDEPHFQKGFKFAGRLRCSS